MDPYLLILVSYTGKAASQRDVRVQSVAQDIVNVSLSLHSYRSYICDNPKFVSLTWSYSLQPSVGSDKTTSNLLFDMEASGESLCKSMRLR